MLGVVKKDNSIINNKNICFTGGVCYNLIIQVGHP